MPKYRVVEAWRVERTFEVEADDEGMAWAGDAHGSYLEVASNDGEYLDTLSVEPLEPETAREGS